jgi:hypothetical protein
MEKKRKRAANKRLRGGSGGVKNVTLNYEKERREDERKIPTNHSDTLFG